MRLQIGYHPDRVRALARQTEWAIDELASIRCADAAAEESLRAVRLLRRNLEEQWMPLLARIQASEAMITWHASALSDPRSEWDRTNAWLTYDETTNRYLDATEQEVIDALRGQSILHQSPLWDQRAVPVDAELTSEVARRVAADPAFADYLVLCADGFTVLGPMLASGLFSAEFASAITEALILSPAAARDLDATSYSIDVAAALDHLASSHPERCLELLGNRHVVEALTLDRSNRSIPVTATENFVTSALAVAPALDDRLLDRSFAALAAIVEVSGGHTVDVGVLRGVVNALAVHLPHLGPELDEGNRAIRPRNSAVTVGSYDELQAFYGQAMGDPNAQAVAGALLSASLDQALERDGPVVVARSAGVDSPQDAASLIGQIALPVSNMVDLLFVDGLASEEQRRNMLVGSRRSADAAWRNLVLAPVSALLPALGAPTGVRAAFAVGRLASDVLPERRSDPPIDQGYRFIVPDQIRAGALELAASSPDARRLAGLDAVSTAGWTTVLGVVAMLQSTDAVAERVEVMRDLDALDEADRIIVDAFLERAADHSRAQDAAT